MSKHEFLNKELKENPEFFKAFPHLQGPIYDKENPKSEGGFEYTDNPRSIDYFEKEDLTSVSSKKDGYFESLLH
jgi:hypothetical protein